MERRQWNTHEEDILRAMFALGKSSAEVAVVLNRTANSVDTRACRLKIKKATGVRVAPPRKKAVKTPHKPVKTLKYIDCMPNPFRCLKGYKFNPNFYRTV